MKNIDTPVGQTPYNYLKQLALGLRKLNDKELIVALVINEAYVSRQDIETLPNEEIDKIYKNVSQIFAKEKYPRVVDTKYMKY